MGRNEPIQTARVGGSERIPLPIMFIALHRDVGFGELT